MFKGLNSDSITLLSEHIIGTPTAIEAQRESSDQMEGYLYLLNSDGHMPVFMSIRKEKVQGWVRYDTTGNFKNIVNVIHKHDLELVIPLLNGPRTVAQIRTKLNNMKLGKSK